MCCCTVLSSFATAVSHSSCEVPCPHQPRFTAVTGPPADAHSLHGCTNRYALLIHDGKEHASTEASGGRPFLILGNTKHYRLFSVPFSSTRQLWAWCTSFLTSISHACDACVYHTHHVKVRGQDAGDDRAGGRLRRRSGLAPHHPDRNQPQGLAGVVPFFHPVRPSRCHRHPPGCHNFVFFIFLFCTPCRQIFWAT